MTPGPQFLAEEVQMEVQMTWKWKMAVMALEGALPPGDESPLYETTGEVLDERLLEGRVVIR